MFRTLPATFLMKKIVSTSKISVRHFTPRRSLLFVPADDIKKVNKALFNIDVDCISLDCEDGVAFSRKDHARTIIREILDKGKPSKKRKYDLAVRVNPISSAIWHDDLQSILTCKNLPDTVSVPKVQSSDELKQFADAVNKLMKYDTKVNLIIYIESAFGVLNLYEICQTAKKLSETSKFVPVACAFGSDDLCADIGAYRTEDALEVLYARQKLVLVAKAFQLQALDMVYIKFKDSKGLKAQAEQSKRMGYSGKQCIHPDQVPIVQDTFVPTADQIKWAENIVKAFEEYQKAGKGAFVYDEHMIDMPTMIQAQNIIKLMQAVK